MTNTPTCSQPQSSLRYPSLRLTLILPAMQPHTRKSVMPTPIRVGTSALPVPATQKRQEPNMRMSMSGPVGPPARLPRQSQAANQLLQSASKPKYGQQLNKYACKVMFPFTIHLIITAHSSAERRCGKAPLNPLPVPSRPKIPVHFATNSTKQSRSKPSSASCTVWTTQTRERRCRT